MFKTSSSIIIVADSHELYLIIGRIDVDPVQGAFCLLTILAGENSLAEVNLTDEIKSHEEIPAYLQARFTDLGFRSAPRLLERLEKIDGESEIDFEQKVTTRWTRVKHNAKAIREGRPWQN